MSSGEEVDPVLMGRAHQQAFDKRETLRVAGRRVDRLSIQDHRTGRVLTEQEVKDLSIRGPEDYTRAEHVMPTSSREGG